MRNITEMELTIFDDYYGGEEKGGSGFLDWETEWVVISSCDGKYWKRDPSWREEGEEDLGLGHVVFEVPMGVASRWRSLQYLEVNVELSL